MGRRLLVLLLNAGLMLSVVGGPCPARAGCMMARAQQADCCAGVKPGISAPRCCTGAQQLSRTGITAATERQLHDGSASASVVDMATVAAAPSVRLTAVPHRPDDAVAPPGRTLVAQHTALLL